MQFVDWDGRPTQYGKLYPDAGGDTPGYLAVLGASFLATPRAAPATRRSPRRTRSSRRRTRAYLDQIDLERRRRLHVELERPLDADRERFIT